VAGVRHVSYTIRRRPDRRTEWRTTRNRRMAATGVAAVGGVVAYAVALFAIAR